MVASVRERLGRLQIEDVLLKYPGLRLLPSEDGCLTLAGDLRFRVQGPMHEALEDAYAVKIRVPDEFPKRLPKAWETGGRIPADFHRLDDGALCLGAPTEQRSVLTRSPTLFTFVDKLLIPYLFGFSFWMRHGTLPYGELDHGEQGILQSISALFGSRFTPEAKEFLRLASLRKRHANKLPCPCRSGRRLGRCHNRGVNSLRDSLGRAWFREEYARVSDNDRSSRTSGLPKARKVI